MGWGRSRTWLSSRNSCIGLADCVVRPSARHEGDATRRRNPSTQPRSNASLARRRRGRRRGVGSPPPPCGPARAPWWRVAARAPQLAGAGVGPAPDVAGPEDASKQTHVSLPAWRFFSSDFREQMVPTTLLEMRKRYKDVQDFKRIAKSHKGRKTEYFFIV